MKWYFRAFTAACALAVCSSGSAQGPRAGAAPVTEVQGTITGESGQPLASATISIHSSADSSLVAGALTDAQGRFHVAGVPAGAFYARVSYVGYDTRAISFEAAPPARSNLGTIPLALRPVELAGVEVNAERATVQLAVDRTVFNARNAAAAGGSATDVLRNVPGVEVDAEGKVSVRGNGNVAIQINGRAAPLRGDALTSYLKQLPASVIDRVELVPNPSAKYDPEGMGGILNLVLRQGTELGLSGGVNLSAATGSKYSGSGNLGWQRGALTLFGMYAFNADARTSDTYTFRTIRGAVPSYMQQDAEGEFGNAGHTGTFNADYRVSPKTTLSASLTANRIDGDLDNLSTYRSFDADRRPTGLLRQTSLIDQTVQSADATLSLRRVMQPQKHELTLELRANGSDDDSRARYFHGAAAERDAFAFHENAVQVAGRDLYAQLDYTRTSASGWKLDLGGKGTLRGLDNASAVLERAAGVRETASDFEYTERIRAAYALLARDVGRLSLQGGLRAEVTGTDFDLNGGERYEDEYTSLFPSASALYSASDVRKIRLSYARRIQRPNTRFLNPFPVGEDRLNQFRGNPRLRPEFTDALELSLQQFGATGSLQLNPFYRRTSDAIRVLKSVDAEGVATTTFGNLATAESYGADVIANGRWGTRVNGMLSMSGFRMTTRGGPADGELGSDALTWNARANVGWKVTPTMDASWFLMYRAPLDVEGGRIRALTMSTLSLQQRLLGNRGTLGVRVNDPLDAMRLRFHTEDASHAQDSWRKMETRILYLTFGYTFGQQPRQRQRPQQPQGDGLDVRIH